MPDNTHRETTAIFHLGGELVMLDGSKTNGDITGYDWDGTTWDYNSDVNSNLGDEDQSDLFLEYADFNNEHWMLVIKSVDTMLSRKWNGTQWVEHAEFQNGLTRASGSTHLAFFKYNDINYLIQSGTSGEIYKVHEWNTSTNSWDENTQMKNGLTDLTGYFSADLLINTQRFGLAPWVDDQNYLHLFATDAYIPAGDQNLSQIIGFRFFVILTILSLLRTNQLIDSIYNQYAHLYQNHFYLKAQHKKLYLELSSLQSLIVSFFQLIHLLTIQQLF